MKPVPPYLAWYLLKIHRHSGEVGYLARRLAALQLEVAVYEKSMLREMSDLHLVALADEVDVFFDAEGGPLVDQAIPVAHNVMGVPTDFYTLARGHWLWTEYVAAGSRWLVTAALGAAIGALVTLLVNGHPGYVD